MKLATLSLAAAVSPLSPTTPILPTAQLPNFSNQLPVIQLPEITLNLPEIVAASGNNAPQSPTRTLHDMDDSLNHNPSDGRGTLDRSYDGSSKKGDAERSSRSNVPGNPSGGDPPSSDSALTPAGRLPSALVPKTYDVRVRLEPKAQTFTGKVAIKAKVARRTSFVVLHALNLDVSKASVGGKPLPASAIKLDREKETVTLELAQALEPGETVVELEYAGKLNPEMRGPYPSKGTHEGKEEHYVFSHFEPTNARRFVPSFDEPNLKAVFNLTVDAPAELTVISNMPQAERSVAGDRQEVKFAPSPKMSSYLLSIYAARLVPAARKKIAGVEVTVWTSPAQADQAGFAMKVIENALVELNKYFDLRYDLPKLDFVTASDFASGAMENWGAILFRDGAILVDPKLSSTRAKRRVANTVTHEIVHMWFGDLVTMDWWDDLWLNEAFATWMATKIVDGWKPEWKLWLEFEQSKKSPLSIDSLRSTRAIASKAINSAEIQGMFDPLTYDKGGSILRMLESFLGEKKFRDGIRIYMKRHKYGNTKAADLWQALEEASGQPVTRVADAWVKTPGYPIVEAAKTGARELTLSQRRFLSERAENDGSVWAVPVVIKYKLKGEAKVRTAKLILDEAGRKVALPGKGELQWAYANAGETGFYRVGMTDEMLSALLAAGPKALTPAEKVGLLGHLWAQAKNGERPISALLDALRAFKADGDRTVLEEVTGYLRAIDETFALDEAGKDKLAAVARELLKPHLAKVGLAPKKGESDEAKLSRSAVVGALSVMGRDAKLDAALDAAVEKHLAAPDKTDPALVTTLLVAGAQHGDAARFDKYLAGMRSATTPERRDQFVRALSEFRAPELARRAMALSLSEDLRPQDAWKPLYFGLNNPATQAVAWEYVKANWQAIKAKVGPRGAAQLVGATSGLTSEAWKADIAAFFAREENAIPIAAKKLAQALDAIGVALKFKAGQTKELERWLGSR